MIKKIYVVLTLCLLFIGLPISATAQKATVIKGIVRDSITHEPIMLLFFLWGAIRDL